MKKYMLTLLILVAIFGSSCSSTYYQRSTSIVVLKDNPTVYEFKDEKVGDSIGVYNKPKGTELEAIGDVVRFGYPVPSYYIISESNGPLCLRVGDIKSKADLALAAQLTKFSLPIAKEKEAWSRAISYVNSHSDMKIQMQTDYLIETYNPMKQGSKGYSISKEIHDQTITIDVKVLGDGVMWSNSEEARKCAYYITNGY